MDASADDSYSQTNEQVAGISEGDIVKTDGRYIYAMPIYGNSLRIVKAEGAKLDIVATISFENVQASEFYLIGDDKLAVVGSAYSYDQIKPEARMAPDYYGWYNNNSTVLLIYDISDRSAPSEARRVSIDGWAVSTRVIGDIVYLVTNKNIWSIPYGQADSQLILPYCRDTAAGEAYEPIGFDSIYYLPDTTDCSYLIVSAVDVSGDAPFEPVAYLGAGSSLYMSHNAIYVTVSRWAQPVAEPGSGIMVDMWVMGGEKTDILRFAIQGTDVAYTGKGSADGSPINQYSMDEYGGYFRIATTDWEKGTYVTVFDAEMNTVGRTEPLAPGERMQSARFMGDMGYVVTFENVDPLFTVDLSDPYNPRVRGELKIPGFSQYLHPVGDGLLLGIGRDTQEIYTRDPNGVETVIGFRDSGIKISLFDVSDPFEPKEIDILKLGEGWAEVSGNPRALMCDPARSLFGFMVESWDSKGQNSGGARIISVENGSLSVAAKLSVGGYGKEMYGSRLCFIGNTLYMVYSQGVDAYNYNTFAKLGSVSF